MGALGFLMIAGDINNITSGHPANTTAATDDGTQAVGGAVPSSPSGAEVVTAAVQQQFDQLKAQECVLLGEFGDFGWWLQGALGLLSFSTLLLKHYNEDRSRRRPVKVFLFDAVKQACGSGALHMMNLLCASLFATCTRHAADPCEWYWLNILLDTTLGVYLVKVLLDVGKRSFKVEGLNAFGYYGDPPQWKACWIQVCIWLALVVVMKLVMVLTMIIAQLPLCTVLLMVEVPIKTIVLQLRSIVPSNSLDNTPRLKLVVVMVLTPFTMNTLQYWVTDNILKSTRGAAGASEYACAEWMATPRTSIPPSRYQLVQQQDAALSVPGEQEMIPPPMPPNAEFAGEQQVADKT